MAWVPPPVPTGRFRGADLERRTLAYCEQYYKSRWGRLTEDDRRRLDYRAKMEAWFRARPVEDSARPLIYPLRNTCDRVLEWLSSYERGTGGDYAFKLSACEEHIKAIVEILENGPDEDPPIPAAEPGIRLWMVEEGNDERLWGLPDGPPSFRDFSVLSLLAGLWPPRYRKTGGGIGAVLTEQDKRVRSAIQAQRALAASLGKMFRQKT